MSKKGFVPILALVLLLVEALPVGAAEAPTSALSLLEQPATGQQSLFLPLIYMPCPLVDILKNGSFEDGPAEWSGSRGVVTDAWDGDEYDGTWLAWFGGYPDANDILYQPLEIPSGCSALKIVFYLLVGTLEPSDQPVDLFYVSLQPVGSVSLPETLIASNLTPQPFWKRVAIVTNSLPPGPLRLYLRGTNDEKPGTHTNFFVDQVAVEASCDPFPAGNKGSAPDWNPSHLPPAPHDATIEK